jgi:hypothetical protein
MGGIRSTRRPFGWDYPAGAEHDPNAPYNQPDIPDECPECGEPNYDEDNHELYDGERAYESRHEP